MTIVRRAFSLTEKDVAILKTVVERCGYVSESEALRAIIKFFEQHAPCMRPST